MKITFLTLTLFMSVALSAQRTPTLKGNRQVERVGERLDNFREIVLNGDLTVQVIPGITNRFELVADDNIRDVMEIGVSGGVLKIDMFYKIRRAKSLELKIYYTEIDRITVRKGKIVLPEVLTAENLMLQVGNDSQLEMKANARRVEAVLEGNGRLNLNADADVFLMEAKDYSDAYVYTTAADVRVMLEDRAKLQLEGKGVQTAFELVDFGSLEAVDYRARFADLKLEGDARADLWVIEKLTLNAQGKTRVDLYGEPAVEITRFLNETQIFKREFKTKE